MELKLSEFEISPTVPPDEMARRIRLAFKRMPEEAALLAGDATDAGMARRVFLHDSGHPAG